MSRSMSPHIPLLLKDNSMNLHEWDLPSEVTHLIRLFVGPHPCAKMVRDFCQDLEYHEHDGEMSLMEYVNYCQEREIRLRIF